MNWFDFTLGAFGGSVVTLWIQVLVETIRARLLLRALDRDWERIQQRTDPPARIDDNFALEDLYSPAPLDGAIELLELRIAIERDDPRPSDVYIAGLERALRSVRGERAADRYRDSVIRALQAPPGSRPN